MYCRTIAVAKCAFFGTTLVACSLFADYVAAEGRPVSVALQVSARGLDLRRWPEHASCIRG